MDAGIYFLIYIEPVLSAGSFVVKLIIENPIKVLQFKYKTKILTISGEDFHLRVRFIINYLSRGFLSAVTSNAVTTVPAIKAII